MVQSGKHIGDATTGSAIYCRVSRCQVPGRSVEVQQSQTNGRSRLWKVEAIIATSRQEGFSSRDHYAPRGEIFG